MVYGRSSFAGSNYLPPFLLMFHGPLFIYVKEQYAEDIVSDYVRKTES